MVSELLGDDDYGEEYGEDYDEEDEPSSNAKRVPEKDYDFM